jgi:hypothetical protein
MAIDNPDKERAHLVNLNGREFIIGTYSENYIEETNGSAPLFIAVYFTEQTTLIADLYALPEDEARLRQIFEDLRISMKSLRSDSGWRGIGESMH